MLRTLSLSAPSSKASASTAAGPATAASDVGATGDLKRALKRKKESKRRTRRAAERSGKLDVVQEDSDKGQKPAPARDPALNPDPRLTLIPPPPSNPESAPNPEPATKPGAAVAYPGAVTGSGAGADDGEERGDGERAGTGPGDGKGTGKGTGKTVREPGSWPCPPCFKCGTTAYKWRFMLERWTCENPQNTCDDDPDEVWTRTFECRDCISRDMGFSPQEAQQYIMEGRGTWQRQVRYDEDQS